jgi:eukaryotic-like serine/threonine-protein kinase
MPLHDQLQASLDPTYRVEREIGHGGMSRTFLAEETALGRRVVVKILPPELAAGLSVDRFKREIALAARLQHPHVVPLLAAGEAAGLPFYTMPFVEGDSLRERLARSGPLPLTEAISILRDVARALAYAHKQGVVHRDIKPDNVLLSHGVAAVTDFGISKAVAAARATQAGVESATLTQLGTAIGTPEYIAPEQAAGDRNTDHRADLYSFAAMAYELVTGSTPFAGRTPAKLLAAHLTETPTPLVERRSDAPLSLAAVVMKCLAKHPEARPRSAEEVILALDAAASELSSARTPGPAERSPTTTAAPSIAVLPFANLNADAESEYFSDGMTADLIAQLGLIDGLAVISRSSVIGFKGAAKGARAVAAELGVTHVLEGSVRRAGARVRIVPTLVDGATGRQLWTKTYDRELEDIFGVQEAVAREIAGALRLPLSQHASARLEMRPTDNLDAYDAFLRARARDGATRGAFDAKLALYERAIELDPAFAVAYTSLAITHITEGAWIHGLGDAATTAADRAIERALRIDPGLAIAYYARAASRWTQGYLRESRAAARRAVDLDPNLAEAMIAHVLADWSLGNYDEMLPWCERAIRLDPKNPYGPNDMVLAYTYMLDFPNAERMIQATLQLRPDWVWGSAIRINEAVAAGRYADAMRIGEEFVRDNPDLPLALMITAEAALYIGKDDEAAKLLARLETRAPGFSLGHHLSWRLMLALARVRLGAAGHDPLMRPVLEQTAGATRAAIDHGADSPWLRLELAAVYALRGEKAEALTWLERGYDAGWRTPYHVSGAPWFASLEQEQRFRDVVARMEADVAAMRQRAGADTHAGSGGGFRPPS